jgi:hypothetical protein
MASRPRAKIKRRGVDKLKIVIGRIGNPRA